MADAFEIHSSGTDVFWGEVPPSHHMMQVYDDEAVFLDTLFGFVDGGLRAGDGVIVIASLPHLAGLEERLLQGGHSLDEARKADRYIPLVAEDVLNQFVVQGWPQERLFQDVITKVIQQAGADGRRVRAFGEMVAVLWSRGARGATVYLEYLWHQLCHTHGFSLLCAYPRIGFDSDGAESLNELCAIHSSVLDAQARRSANS